MILIDFIEISVRGGAAALCITLMLQLLVQRPITPTAIFGSMFLLGAATYSVIAISVMRDALGNWLIPIKLIGIMSPAFFWLFIEAMHDDAFKWRWWKSLPPVTIGGLYIASVIYPPFDPISRALQVVLVTILMALTIHRVRCCYRDDLVAARRHFGRTMRILVPMVAASIIGIEILEAVETDHPVARIIVAFAILICGIIMVLSASKLRSSLIPVPAKPHQYQGAAREMSAADRIDLGRLRDLMEEGAYLNPGLSIGELANQMSIPEHRLRKLINSGLGYRNFAAFMNDHRIDEAKRRLARPTFAREQITSLAFDLGYTSLAPFNRAFKERTGESPTEYRANILNDRIT